MTPTSAAQPTDPVRLITAALHGALPRAGRTEVLAIDGRSGSGKTTGRVGPGAQAMTSLNSMTKRAASVILPDSDG